MKKYTLIILVIVAAVLVSTSPAQAIDGYLPSYYQTQAISERGLLAVYNERVLFDSSMFDTAVLGIFLLNGDTFTTQGYSGLVRLTGSCYTEKPSDLVVSVYTDAGVFIVATPDQGEDLFDFEFVTSSPWLQIGVVSLNEGRYTLLKCAYLFEAVV